MSAFGTLLAVPLAVLTLQQAEQQALSKSPDIMAANAQRTVASGRATEQLGPLLPQLSANANYTYRKGESVSSFNRDLNTYLMGVSGTMLLTDFGRSSNRYQAFKDRYRAADASAEGVVLTTLASVRLAYIDALESKALVEVAEETLTNQQRHLERIQAFVEVGTRPAIDVVRLQTDVAQSRAALIQAQNNYQVAKVSLNQVMGVIAKSEYDIEEPQFVELSEESQAPDQLLEIAEHERPELAAQQYMIRAQQHSVKSAKRLLVPELRANGQLNYSNEAFKDPLWSSLIAATFNWTFFDGWSSIGSARAEKGQLQFERAQFNSVEQGVWREIEEARVSVISTKAQLEAAEQALKSAQELLRLAEERYKEGAGDALELSDAQLDLTSASVSWVRVKYDLAAARTDLLRALGRRSWQ